MRIQNQGMPIQGYLKIKLISFNLIKLEDQAEEHKLCHLKFQKIH